MTLAPGRGVRASRDRLLVGASLAICAVFAWVLTARLAGEAGMAMSLEMMAMHEMGVAEAVSFIAMWVAMMIAMMVPVVSPTVLAHHMVISKRGGGVAPSMIFVAGYIGAWSAIGLVPLALFVFLPDLVMSVGTQPLVFAGGALLVAGGIYQFTHLKEACLRHCRHPLQFLMTHDFDAGRRHTFRAGIMHGAYCVGCCWAFMLVVIAVGMTNLIWMLLITMVFLMERWWKRGALVGRAVGPVLATVGTWLVLVSL